MANESKFHDSEMKSFNVRIKALQLELEKANNQKESNKAKVKELDQLVGQLLSVNDSLVDQLSGKATGRRRSSEGSIVNSLLPQSTEKDIKKSKKKSITPVNLVPRVASVTTAALQAGKVNKVSTERLVPVKSDEIQQLQKLHKLYSDIAESILERKQNSNTLSGNASSKKKSAKNKPATRISHKKSMMDNDEVSGIDLREKSTSKHGNNISVHVPGPKYASYDDSAILNTSMTSNFSNHSSYANPHSPSLNSAVKPNRSFSKLSQKHSSNFNNMTATNDIQDVISSLEDEFDSLNQQYRNLLGSVQSEDTSNDTTARAEELISVIQKLHKKGEQLRALKSPMKA